MFWILTSQKLKAVSQYLLLIANVQWATLDQRQWINIKSRTDYSNFKAGSKELLQYIE